MPGKIDIPILKVRKGASLREIYARIRKEFSAADLQRYTVVEQGVPAEVVLADLEKIQAQEERKLAKKNRKKS